MKQLLLILTFFFLSNFLPEVSSARLYLPQKLTHAERLTTLEVLGLGTSHRLITQPYPLGGYHGFQLSGAYERISLSRLQSIDPSARVTDALQYAKLEAGKGLYENIDLFLHFVPYETSNQMSEYGGSIRWNVYTSPQFPAYFNLVLQGNSANFRNQILSQTLNAVAQLGFGLKYFSFNFSTGLAKAYGRFIGGANGITDSDKLEGEQVSGSQFGVNGILNIDEYFIALAFDRYTEPITTLKMGYTF